MLCTGVAPVWTQLVFFKTCNKLCHCQRLTSEVIGVMKLHQRPKKSVSVSALWLRLICFPWFLDRFSHSVFAFSIIDAWSHRTKARTPLVNREQRQCRSLVQNEDVKYSMTAITKVRLNLQKPEGAHRYCFYTERMVEVLWMLRKPVVPYALLKMLCRWMFWVVAQCPLRQQFSQAVRERVTSIKQMHNVLDRLRLSQWWHHSCD